MKPAIDLFNLIMPLAGRILTADELATMVEDIYLKAIDRYEVPDGLDPIHYIDLAIDLGWIRFDRLGRYFVFVDSRYYSIDGT